MTVVISDYERTLTASGYTYRLPGAGPYNITLAVNDNGANQPVTVTSVAEGGARSDEVIVQPYNAQKIKNVYAVQLIVTGNGANISVVGAQSPEELDLQSVSVQQGSTDTPPSNVAVNYGGSVIDPRFIRYLGLSDLPGDTNFTRSPQSTQFPSALDTSGNFKIRNLSSSDTPGRAWTLGTSDTPVPHGTDGTSYYPQKTDSSGNLYHVLTGSSQDALVLSAANTSGVGTTNVTVAPPSKYSYEIEWVEVIFKVVDEILTPATGGWELTAFYLQRHPTRTIPYFYSQYDSGGLPISETSEPLGTNTYYAGLAISPYTSATRTYSGDMIVATNLTEISFTLESDEELLCSATTQFTGTPPQYTSFTQTITLIPHGKKVPL